MDYMGYTYDDETKKKAVKPKRDHASIFVRLILALLSFLLPGLGQSLQRRHLEAFNMVLLHGAGLLIGKTLAIQWHLGVMTPIVMWLIILLPSIIAAIGAFRSKNHPGDADTVVRNFFLYAFFYLIAIGPFYLINNNFGYKVYRFSSHDIHMEPLGLPGDAVIFYRGAYKTDTFGPRKIDSIKIGDFVYHKAVPEEIGGDNFPVHMILAAPGDTLRAVDGKIMVNSMLLKTNSETQYSGLSNFGPVVVPKTQVFLVDNRGVFFPFYIENIQGKEIGILWSKDNRGRFRWDRFGMPIEAIASPFENLADSTSSSDTLQKNKVFDTDSTVESDSSAIKR